MAHPAWVRTTVAGVVVVWVMAAPAPAQQTSPWLYGLHWYRTDGDVEALTVNKGVWLLETVMTWDGGWSAPSQLSKFQVAALRGHTIICRLQPRWGWAVPLESEMPNYLAEVAATADMLKNVCHIWQIGNEMNGLNEYGGQYLEPAVYVERFKQIRNAIRTVNSPLGEQMVLLGPPGVLAYPYWPDMLAEVDGDRRVHDARLVPRRQHQRQRNIDNAGGSGGWRDRKPADRAPRSGTSPSVTEFDRCNHPANDPTQEATQPVSYAYARPRLEPARTIRACRRTGLGRSVHLPQESSNWTATAQGNKADRGGESTVDAFSMRRRSTIPRA
jgi:hypothetical protein